MFKNSLKALMLTCFGLTSMAHADEPTRFTVTIKKVSTSETLKLPDGSTADAPVAPGVFAVAVGPGALFTRGGFANKALEHLAEDGDFEPLLAQAQARKNLTAAGMFVPGQSFTVTAKPGDVLDFAAMFVQSNDLFYAPKGGGIPLFDKGGRAMMGDRTGLVELYDAGTEVNQASGAGPDQAPRQAKANTGASEHEPTAPIASRHDGFTYPPVSAVIEVEIVPAAPQN